MLEWLLTCNELKRLSDALLVAAIIVGHLVGACGASEAKGSCLVVKSELVAWHSELKQRRSSVVTFRRRGVPTNKERVTAARPEQQQQLFHASELKHWKSRRTIQKHDQRDWQLLAIMHPTSFLGMRPTRQLMKPMPVRTPTLP